MFIKVKREIELALVIFSLGITLSGCQTAADKASQKNDPAATKQTNSVMPDKATTPAPQTANAEQPAKGEVQIVIENFVFTPADVTVAPGTKVTWINRDDSPHTATALDKKFNSGGLDTDEKFSFVFTDKGDYPYICTLHPQMKAQIKVK